MIRMIILIILIDSNRRTETIDKLRSIAETPSKSKMSTPLDLGHYNSLMEFQHIDPSSSMF